MQRSLTLRRCHAFEVMFHGAALIVVVPLRRAVRIRRHPFSFLLLSSLNRSPHVIFAHPTRFVAEVLLVPSSKGSPAAHIRWVVRKAAPTFTCPLLRVRLAIGLLYLDVLRHH